MTPEAFELDWLKRWNLYAPDAVALKMGEDGRTWTYRDLFEGSLRLAGKLRRRFGIEVGDRVACLAQNELEYICLFFALQRLGAILVPINFRFTPTEVGNIVRDSGAKVLCYQKIFRTTAETQWREVELWAFDGAPDSLCAAIEDGEPFTGFMAEAERGCMILYTSGTTGFPKGAIITPKMIFWNSINTGLRLNLTEQDSVITFLPLFHTGGWNVLTTPCLHRGAKVVLLRKFDPELVLRLCAQEQLSVLFGVPTTMERLRRSPQFSGAELSTLRYAIVGGEPMPIEAIGAWEARGIPIRQGYGLTEFGPNVFSLSEADSRRKMGSIGFPNFYIEARVVNGVGQVVKNGDVGELILRGPVAMAGYWNNPIASANVIKDGWLYTGDLVRQDEEGYFFVIGRKKEMYISGGENVYPAEVERVLRACPGVVEAAVIGVPNVRWGESGRAFVVLSGELGGAESLRAHCQRELAKFKVPLEFVRLDQLPKTESGKIAKTQLVEFSAKEFI